MSTAVAVVPPLGPLAWVYGALAELEGDAGPDAIDLRRERLTPAEVLDRARARGATRVELVDGPRAATLRGLLLRAQLELGDAPLDVVQVERGAGSYRPYERIALERGEPLAGGPPGAVALAGAPIAATPPNPAAAAERRWFTARTVARIPSSWWGLVPVDYDPASRAAWRRLLAREAPQQRLDALAWESLALAGVDVYAESIARALPPVDEPVAEPVDEPGPTRPLVIAVCGVDGAGKSSHLDALEQRLAARALGVERLKIYRHGVFHATVTDLNRGSAGERDLHRWPLQRTAKLHDSLEYFESDVRAAGERADVLLFDRYLPTHHAMANGRYGWDPYVSECLAVYPRADLIVFLDLPTGEALARLERRSYRTVDENPTMMALFADSLRERAQAGGWLIVDSREPFESNRDAIGAAVDRLVEGARR